MAFLGDIMISQQQFDELQHAIRRHTPQINAEIEPKGIILDQLFGQGFITATEKRSIEKIKSRAERATELMNLLFEKSNPNVFFALRIILKNIFEYEWIVKEINDGLYNEINDNKIAQPLNLEKIYGLKYVALEMQDNLLYDWGQLTAGLVSSPENLPEKIHTVEFRASDNGSLPIHVEITDYLKGSSHWSSLVGKFPVSARDKIQTVVEDLYSLGRCLHAAWKGFESFNAGFFFAHKITDILFNGGFSVTECIQDSIKTVVKGVMSQVVSKVKSEEQSEGTFSGEDKNVEVGKSEETFSGRDKDVEVGQSSEEAEVGLEWSSI